uniref:Uncharacterized protein n=1 Tax=Physcomitrium patens TaxID=3218 RepID=A0A2K1J4B5_PHYPA|nr:hypothetical protein PHYPA_022222 [Physcomitrium patens]
MKALEMGTQPFAALEARSTLDRLVVERKLQLSATLNSSPLTIPLDLHPTRMRSGRDFGSLFCCCCKAPVVGYKVKELCTLLGWRRNQNLRLEGFCLPTPTKRQRMSCSGMRWRC